MKRTPVPDTTGHPRCFGFLSPGEHPDCPTCGYAVPCVQWGMEWKERLSLSELLHVAELRFSVEGLLRGEGVMDPLEVYAVLYEKHFGRRPSAAHLEAARTVRILYRVQAYCRASDIELAMYIGAQMRGMKKGGFPVRFGRSIGFQPNMLLGEKALRRYDIDVQKGRKRFQSPVENVHDSDTMVGKLMDLFTLDEMEVAEYFVHATLVGEDVTWGRAIKQTHPSEEWYGVDLVERGWPGTRALSALRQDFTHTVVFGCKEVGRLRAAVSIAAQVKPGLADRIGASVFEWPAFADMLLDRFGPKIRRPAPDLSGVSGELKWS